MKARFIVLIDFSSYSRFELQLAKRWADGMMAEVLLLHQPAIFIPALADKEASSAISRYEVQKATDKLKTFASQNLPDTRRVAYKVAEGNLLVALQQLFGEYYYHIIFVGLKGTGFLKRIFMGSTAVQVIDQINCVTVAVPRHSFNMSPDTFFVSVHHRYPLNTSELDRLLALFGSRIRHIRFISVITGETGLNPARAYLEKLAAQYRAAGRQTSFETFEGKDAFYELKQYMNRRSDGLLLVQRGSRSLTDQMFRKFLINELVYDASIPLIVLPSDSEELM